MRYAVIREESHNVINVIEWDGETPFSLPTGRYLVESEDAGIGHVYDPATKTFSDPNAPADEAPIE